MFFCLVGAMILCVLMAIHLRGRHKLFLFAPSDEFYRINFGQKKEEKTVWKKRPSGLDGPLFMSTGRAAGVQGAAFSLVRFPGCDAPWPPLSDLCLQHPVGPAGLTSKHLRDTRLPAGNRVVIMPHKSEQKFDF